MAGIRHGSRDERGSACSKRWGSTTRTPPSTDPCSAVPAASAKEVAATVGMPVARVRAIIDELEQLGLLARQASQSDRVVASPPAIALKPLLLERERGLTRAHEALHRVQRAVPASRPSSATPRMSST